MKKVLLFLAVLLGSLTVAGSSQAAGLSERLKGRFLLSVEQQGQIWYVTHDTGLRQPVFDADQAWALVLKNLVGIKKVDLNLVPMVKVSKMLPAQQKMVDRLKGRFLLAVEDHGRVWYVNPVDGLRYEVKRGVASFERIKQIALEISVANLYQIGIDQQAMMQPVIITETTNLEDLQNEPAVYVAPQRLDINVVKARLAQVQYNDAGMGWNFASSLWKAYQKYAKERHNYPELKWFENVLEYNQPIYFDQTGFTLVASTDSYWNWNDLSDEFFKFYFNHVKLIIEQDGNAVLKFNLPTNVETVEYGSLPAGNYYFSVKEGLLNQASYEARGRRVSMSLENVNVSAEAQRVADEVERIQTGLETYIRKVGGYPIIANKPLVLGEKNSHYLTKEWGFTDEIGGKTILIANIANGAPTTDIIYDSRLGGLDFVVTFTLLVETKKYEKGVYEMNPLGIHRIGPVPTQN